MMGLLDPPVVSAPRFYVMSPGWTTGLGFSKLAGFTSEVESQEYSSNGRWGISHTKQFGRTKPQSFVLERALDRHGFFQLYAWHSMARMNNPTAKVPVSFDISTKAGEPVFACLLENAWCSKLELDAAQAGGASVLMMRATITCDGLTPV